jgi:hypothetical protein
MRALKQTGLKLHSETIGILDTLGSRRLSPRLHHLPHLVLMTSARSESSS